MESTFVMVKPDGVKRRLTGEIIRRIERKGYNLLAIKTLTPTREIIESHYAEHTSKPFFAGLADNLASGNVVAMVWSGKNAVKACRQLIGETDPAKSSPGTIRGDFGIDLGRNVVHGSDSVESALREIGIWFGEQPVSVKSHDHDLIYE